MYSLQKVLVSVFRANFIVSSQYIDKQTLQDVEIVHGITMQCVLDTEAEIE